VKRAVVVTATSRHHDEILPVIWEAKKHGWEVLVFRLERFFNKIDISKLVASKRSLDFFYARKELPERRVSSLCYDALARTIAILIRALKLSKSSVILVESDHVLPCRIAVLVGKHARIPSLLLLHQGVIGYNYSISKFLVDKIGVIGPFAREILVSRGVPKNKIVVTGRPAYDDLGKLRFNKLETCRKFGLDPNKKIFLYTTENIGALQTRKRVYAICRAIRKLVIQFQSSGQLTKVPGFFIKVHPDEDMNSYVQIVNDVGADAHISKTGNFYEILSMCDVLITGFSTATLDAMILGKPVITINLTKFRDPLPYAESGAAIGVYDEESLQKEIESALYDENVKAKLRQAQKKFIYEHAYKIDGKCSERVVKIMEQMVKQTSEKEK